MKQSTNSMAGLEGSIDTRSKREGRGSVLNKRHPDGKIEQERQRTRWRRSGLSRPHPIVLADSGGEELTRRLRLHMVVQYECERKRRNSTIRKHSEVRTERKKDQSTRGRFLLTFPFAAAACWPSTDSKYSSEPLGSAFIVLPPSFQLAGQTSPCSS